MQIASTKRAQKLMGASLVNHVKPIKIYKNNNKKQNEN